MYSFAYLPTYLPVFSYLPMYLLTYLPTYVYVQFRTYERDTPPWILITSAGIIAGIISAYLQYLTSSSSASSHFYIGSLFLASIFHLVLSLACSSPSHLASKSFFSLSFHLSFGLLLLLRPSTCDVMTLFPTYLQYLTT